MPDPEPANDTEAMVKAEAGRREGGRPSGSGGDIKTEAGQPGEAGPDIQLADVTEGPSAASAPSLHNLTMDASFGAEASAQNHAAVAFVGAGNLEGTSVAQSSASGTMVGVGALQGTSAAESSATGTLSVSETVAIQDSVSAELIRAKPRMREGWQADRATLLELARQERARCEAASQRLAVVISTPTRLGDNEAPLWKAELQKVGLRVENAATAFAVLEDQLAAPAPDATVIKLVGQTLATICEGFWKAAGGVVGAYATKYLIEHHADLIDHLSSLINHIHHVAPMVQTLVT